MSKTLKVLITIDFDEPVTNIEAVVQNIQSALFRQMENCGLSSDDEEAYVENLDVEVVE